MTIRAPAVGDLVRLTWTDTTNVGAWMEPADIADWAGDNPGLCWNVGWVTYVDGTCVCVSARQSDTLEPKQFGLTERIPLACISMIEKLS